MTGQLLFAGGRRDGADVEPFPGDALVAEDALVADLRRALELPDPGGGVSRRVRHPKAVRRPQPIHRRRIRARKGENAGPPASPRPGTARTRPGRVAVSVPLPVGSPRLRKGA